MNTESELYKAGHPSTWQVGDILASPCNEWELLEIDGLENIVRLQARPKPWSMTHHWHTIENLRLVRRANQQENKVEPVCTRCDEEPATEPEQSPLWCKDCLKKHQDEYAKEVEEMHRTQKLTCHCCTQQEYGANWLEQVKEHGYIEHVDPCQFTSAERYMLPIAKAQFRERQLAKKVEAFEASVREADAGELARTESWFESNRHVHGEHRNVKAYSRLTGHKFE